MSVWKSPVFYFGAVLLLVVSMALAAPYVVNWDAYKSDLEAYGSRLSGRNVVIKGPVAVRLFPWPSLTASDVTIDNPPGFGGVPFVDVELISARLALAALFNGSLVVESVEVRSPKVTLLRAENGKVNWLLDPDENVKNSRLLSQVKLDHISLTGGSLRLEDRERGYAANVTSLEANMSAQSIEGPWRIAGTANWRELAMGFSFTSSERKPGDPFRFGFRLAPSDKILPTVALDGAWDGRALAGSLNIVPQEVEDEKSSFEGGLRPLTLQSKITATDRRIDLSAIRIAPADRKDSGTLIEGTARIDLARQISAAATLTAPRVNVDTLIGAETLTTWRNGGILAVADAIMEGIPEQVVAELGLDVNVLTAGGETLENVAFKAVAGKQAIRIVNARASLPGRSVMKFAGVIFPKDGAAELGGNLAFESNDLRAFAGWAMPQAKPRLDSLWKGSRGRIKLQSDVTWRAAKFGFENLEYELEGSPGSGGIFVRAGAVPGIDLRLGIKSIDLDSFLPSGVSASRDIGAFKFLALLDPVLNTGATMEKRLTLDAGSVTLNGVTAQDVALDFSASLKGIEVKAFDIGSVGGARLKAEGLVINGGNGPSGDLSATLVAADPGGFIRLLGLGGTGRGPEWVRNLGQTDLVFKLAVKPEAAGPVLAYALSGKSGAFDVALSGDVSELDRGSDARFAITGNISSAEAGRFLALAGMAPKSADTGPGKVSVSLSGARNAGFAAKFDGEGFGARLAFDGTVKPDETYGAASGAASVIIPDTGPLMRVLGAPIAGEKGASLRLAGKIATENGLMRITDLVGDQGGFALSGELNLDGEGKLQGDLATGPLALADIMVLAFMPWSGSGFDIGDTFAGSDGLPIAGEVWLRPTLLQTPLSEDIKETVVGLALVDGARKLSLRVPTQPDISFDLTVKPEGGSFEVAGEGKFVADLARVLRMADGTVLADGKSRFAGSFKSKGRSPAAALSEMTGEGNFALDDMRLMMLAPAAFAARIKDVKSSGELSDALALLEASSGLTSGPQNGTVAIVRGVASTSSVKVQGAGVVTDISARVDLPEGAVELQSAVGLTERPDLPPVTISYAGKPGAAMRRSGSSALAAKLGYELLAKDMKELERLQNEQQKMLDAEEAQRQQDAAKYEAYQAQRAELRLRSRELRVHANERRRKSDIAKAAFARFVPEGDAINRTELARNRLRLHVAQQLVAWKEEKERLEREAKEALERKKAEEEAARLKALEEQRAAEEAARLKALEEQRAAEEAARLKALEEQRAAEEAARLKALEEQRAAEEAARLKALEGQRAAEEAARLKALEEQKAAEEAARMKLLQELKAPEQGPDAMGFQQPLMVPQAPAVIQPQKPPCAGIYC